MNQIPTLFLINSRVDILLRRSYILNETMVYLYFRNLDRLFQVRKLKPLHMYIFTFSFVDCPCLFRVSYSCISNVVILISLYRKCFGWLWREFKMYCVLL